MNEIKNIIEAIHSYLDKTNPCNEHDLIQHLKESTIPPFTGIDLKQSKDLFSAHFLTRHALYQLQNRYLSDESFMLELGMTEIKRTPYIKGDDSLTIHDAVKDYYLDIKHYLETSEDEVNELLTSFWGKYLAHGSKHSDLEVLGLNQGASYDEVKRQYRSLAQKHHPDKGGCAQRFGEIKQAKENLDRLFK